MAKLPSISFLTYDEADVPVWIEFPKILQISFGALTNYRNGWGLRSQWKWPVQFEGVWVSEVWIWKQIVSKEGLFHLEFAKNQFSRGFDLYFPFSYAEPLGRKSRISILVISGIRPLRLEQEAQWILKLIKRQSPAHSIKIEDLNSKFEAKWYDCNCFQIMKDIQFFRHTIFTHSLNLTHTQPLHVIRLWWLNNPSLTEIIFFFFFFHLFNDSSSIYHIQLKTLTDKFTFEYFIIIFFNYNKALCHT